MIGALDLIHAPEPPLQCAAIASFYVEQHRIACSAWNQTNVEWLALKWHDYMVWSGARS